MLTTEVKYFCPIKCFMKDLLPNFPSVSFANHLEIEMEYKDEKYKCKFNFLAGVAEN